MWIKVDVPVLFTIGKNVNQINVQQKENRNLSNYSFKILHDTQLPSI